MALSGSHLLPQIVLAFVVSAWLCPTASAQRQPARYVLAVYWSSEDSPANAAVDAALRQVLSRSAVPVEYSAEYLSPLAFSDVALQFVLLNRGELFPEAPVVYAGGRWPDADTDRTTAGLTGVVYANGWRENLELVLKLHPSTERVFVIAQAPNYPLAASVQAGLRAYERRVPITYIDEPSMPHLIAALKAVPSNSVIYYVRHSQEDHGKIVFPSDVARVVAEASAQQVLLNLIVNGIDATEQIESGSRRIEIATSLSPERCVKVSVGDNGVGLAGVDLQRMFSLSYTTKTDGTGIGLSLSRSIVEAHGGDLWAEQNLGAEATFSFTVPIDTLEVATDREQRESVQVV